MQHPPAEKAGHLAEDSDAMRFLHEMDQMRKIWKSFRPEGDLSKNTLSMLAFIDRLEQKGHTPISVSELAGMLRHSVPAVSQKVTVLEQQGYLERSGNPEDRRVCYVRLSEAGRLVARESFHQFLQRVDNALAELGPVQVEELLQLMHQLTDAIARQCDLGKSEQMEE